MHSRVHLVAPVAQLTQQAAEIGCATGHGHRAAAFPRDIPLAKRNRLPVLPGRGILDLTRFQPLIRPVGRRYLLGLDESLAEHNGNC